VAKAAKYIAVLGAALAVVGLLTGAVAAQRYGSGAYEASAVAVAINWIAGSVALAAIVLSRNEPWRVHASLIAMGSRMALPLMALMFFSESPGRLTAHGVVGLILVQYFVGLILETLISLRVVKGQASNAPGPGTTSLPGPQPGRLAAHPEK
jgi:predicted aconitase with swiveling domain